MAKKALLGVLENTIGKYVQDLDAEKLNLGLWSGQVELHDLQLDVVKCNAELDRQAAEAPNLAVPLKVVDGTFTSLKLDIPWTHLSSQSVVMKAHGLHITVSPHDRLHETDFMKVVVDSEEKRALHIQKARNQSVELANATRLQTKELMKLTHSMVDDDDKSSNKSDGFVARLVKRIIENLMIEITDVQITIQQPDGATAGMVLENLSFVTTDMAGHRTFVDRTGSENPSDLLNKFLYKKLQIEGLALFVDDGKDSGEEKATPYNYVLEPLDFKAKFREADASITKDYAKWLLRSNVPAVKLGYSHSQYQQTMALMAAISPSPHAAQPLFPEYRPLHRITQTSAKDWWRYAYKCVGRLNGRRSWMNFYQAFKARKTYVQLYKRYAHASNKDYPWLQPLTKDETLTLQQIEADRTISVEGIMIWRNLADGQVEKEWAKRELSNPDANKKKKKKGVLSSLFGSSSSDNSADADQDETPISLSPEELKELEDVGMAGFGEELSEESKLASVEFILGEFSIHLTNAANKPMLGLEMGQVSAKFEADQGGSLELSYRLSSLEVLDHLHSSSLFPSLVRSLQGPQAAMKAPTPEDEDVFQLHLSKSKKGDKQLSVKLIPFEAVLAPHLLTEVMDFVALPPSDSQVEATTTRGPEMEEMVEANADDKKKDDDAADGSTTTESISNALVEAWQEKTKEKTSLTIDLDLQAPILVLPENCSDPNASVLVLDLGGFKFRYGFDDHSPKVVQWLQENPRDADSHNLSTLNGEDKQANFAVGTVVDHGRIELQNMTFIVGQAESWRRISSMRENHMAEQEAIIEPITVTFDFAVESVVSSSIPRACVFSTIPSSTLRVSPNHLSMTLCVYNAWMKTLETISASSRPASDSTAIDENTVATAISTSSERSLLSQSQRAFAENITEITDQNVVIEMDHVKQAIEATMSNERVFFTTMFFSVTAENYSFAVFDSGGFQSTLDDNVKNSHSGSISPLLNVSEGVVFAGGAQLTFQLASDKTGTASSVEVDIKGTDFEIFRAFGKDLRRPIQTVEPVTGALNVSLITQGPKTKKTTVRAEVLDAIDVTFSMGNLALINTISAEFSECLAAGLKKQEESTFHVLDEKKTREIEAMSLALDGDGEICLLPNPETHLETSNCRMNLERASSSIIVVDMRVPKSTLTIVNDLQGLDDALFRVEMEKLVAKSMIATLQDIENPLLTETVFNGKLHTKINADYFDPQINLWKDLLIKPWEIELKGERMPDKKSKSDRFCTRADIHFMPLHVSFSQHFLIGLSSANKMLAMSRELEEDAKTKNNKPGSSARHLVAALPYALDNFSGLDVEYELAETRVGKRKCPNKAKQYFRFNPPKGRGYGGKRQYGQDVTTDLSIKLFVGKDTIEIARLDKALGRPKRCYILEDLTMVVTMVVKEGMTTVCTWRRALYFRISVQFTKHCANVATFLFAGLETRQ